jgi:CO2 hydration protein
MISTQKLEPSRHPLADYVHRLEAGAPLLDDSPRNVLEVVGILKSYGVVLDAYSRNLIHIADCQFLVMFPFFKYFNSKVSFHQLLKHWWHDRINFEYAEYCMKAMMWHGGGGLDAYLDSDAFRQNAQAAIAAKLSPFGLMRTLNRVFPEFLVEHMRMMAYYSALGQFWRVMSDIFVSLSDRYDRGKVTAIPQVVEYIKQGLVDAASRPITYTVTIKGKTYDLLPIEAGLTFLMDTAVPYVEAVFFRGTPFAGTISYNAQAYQIPYDQGQFAYGALYADPLPIGGAGIPPTLLMQDMRHFLPEYLHDLYRKSFRKEEDLLVQVCMSFQKSMFCVTSAAILGLAPFPLDSPEVSDRQANRRYFEGWMDRLVKSRLKEVNR